MFYVSHINMLHICDSANHQLYQWCAPQEIVQSPIIRKLGRLEGGSTLVCECSHELIDILLCASMTIHTPSDALALLASYDYLLVKPSIMLLAYAQSHAHGLERVLSSG